MSAMALSSSHLSLRPQQHQMACFSGRASVCWRTPGQTCHHSSSLVSLRRSTGLHRALSQETYQGMYGPWRIEEADRQEVLGYRAGLTVAAAALFIDTLISWLPVSEDSGLKQILRPLTDVIAVAGAGGFGASLYLIHIYVKPIKRVIQSLYAVGLAGGLYLMATQPLSLPEYVGAHREAVWAVGPLFAAVTGVAFKEGMCYGKAECAGLFFTVPTLLLGHLSGFLPHSAEQVLLGIVVALATVFAGRKYTQPIKDDIGDKSIFEFLALSEEEQEARVAELRRSKAEQF